MTPATFDLFAPPSPTQLVQLDRHCDRVAPCCHNVAFVRPRPDTPHAAELRCADCDRHRGWMPQEAMKFLAEVAKRFGPPNDPIVLRDQTIGDDHMQRQRDGSGVLFRNDKKQDPKHADYNGSITIGNVEYWLNGWVREGSTGKFLSLSAKPKNADTAKAKADFQSEEIPF